MVRQVVHRFPIVTAILLHALILGPVGVHAAQGTIYGADIAARVNVTKDQESRVREILKKNEAAMTAILTRNGIDPADPNPEAQKIYKASGALSELGKRTRAELEKVLDAGQMALYDQVVAEVEQRIRNAVKFVGREDASNLK